MKKNFMLFAAALVVFAACNKEQDFEQSASNNFEIYATVEQQTDDNATKSSLNGTTVSWTANDSVKVFDESAHSTQMKAASSGESVTFTENTSKRDKDFSDEDMHYAIYPYSAGATCSGSTISFSLPATQNYVANSFAQDANVAVASFSGSSVASFRNACGVFKLSIIGNYTVSKIELSGKSDEKLNGTFTVNAADDPFVGAAASGDPTDEEKVLTLNCGTSGVTLSPTDTTTFYFVVPVGAFASGFTAKVYEKDNATAYTYTELSTTSANTIVRSKVKAMPENTILPPAYQKVEYLQSSGTQYIDTEISAPNGFEVDLDCFVSDYSNGYSYYIIGSHNSVAPFGRNNFSLNTTTSAPKIAIGAGGYGSVTANVTQKLNLKGSTEVGDVWLKINNISQIITLQDASDLRSSNTLYLFKLNGYTSDVTKQFNGKIYYCKLSIGDDLAGYFIPARTNSTPTTYGMYDIITKKFFTNQGTGSFGVGLDVKY